MRDMHLHSAALYHAKTELEDSKIRYSSQEKGLPSNDKALYRLLPQRTSADPLVRIYIENLEITHRVLHLPSFIEEYNRMWDSPHEARPDFVALLLLMLATARCINREEQVMFRGASSLSRETAIMWIEACDSWLQTQSHKHVTITNF